MDKIGKKEWDKLNVLRQEQRNVVERLNQLETDLTETKLVAEALQKVDPERRCYRSQGGVLVEHRVKDVIPVLDESKKQLDTLVSRTRDEITEKGKAIQAFMTENNIAFRKQ